MIDEECLKCKRYFSGSCNGVENRKRKEITIENRCSGFLKNSQRKHINARFQDRNGGMNMYYDVVVSIYESEKCNTRTDSELVCGGFETEEEAEEYIRNNEINEYKYTYSDEDYPVIEIEEHNDDGCLKSIITGIR